ncbi:hypothetical protein U2A4042440013 [Corynebacterium striatum]|nr:hypothetical protein U2A4042440013 [Corynebacterium striatum]
MEPRYQLRGLAVPTTPNRQFVAQMNEATRILTLLEKRNDALALLGKSLEQRYFSAS